MKVVKFIISICLLAVLPLTVNAETIHSDVSYVSYSAEITGTFVYRDYPEQTLMMVNIVHNKYGITLHVQCPGAVTYSWTLLNGDVTTQYYPRGNYCDLSLGSANEAGLRVDAYDASGNKISTHDYYFSYRP